MLKNASSILLLSGSEVGVEVLGGRSIEVIITAVVMVVVLEITFTSLPLV